MKCPTDGTVLTMSERAGVEIDYCPECRGVWLDRGELDKILDRAVAEGGPAASAQPTAPSRPPQSRYDEPRYDDRRSPGDQRYGSQQPYRRKKKEHWLMEIFD